MCFSVIVDIPTRQDCGWDRKKLRAFSEKRRSIVKGISEDILLIRYCTHNTKLGRSTQDLQGITRTSTSWNFAHIHSSWSINSKT